MHKQQAATRIARLDSAGNAANHLIVADGDQAVDDNVPAATQRMGAGVNAAPAEAAVCVATVGASRLPAPLHQGFSANERPKACFNARGQRTGFCFIFTVQRVRTCRERESENAAAATVSCLGARQPTFGLPARGPKVPAALSPPRSRSRR